jgi:ABC-type Mn2+/Zn2+ transport system permease subunit
MFGCLQHITLVEFCHYIIDHCRCCSPAAGKAFVAGFLGLFLLWAGMALLKDAANDHVLSTKVAGILPLGGSYLVLILVTGVVGGLVSGLAALTGSYLRRSR